MLQIVSAARDRTPRIDAPRSVSALAAFGSLVSAFAPSRLLPRSAAARLAVPLADSRLSLALGATWTHTAFTG